MNSRERFETWFRKEHPNDSGIAAGWYCWQAAERDMLERAIAMGDSICAKSTSLGGEDMLIPDLLDELKELLK